MSHRLIIRPQADRDLDEQFDYIVRRNPIVARRFYEAARATFEDLVDSPSRGGAWEATTSIPTDLRVWPIRGFKNHLIFYRPTGDGIEVIRVLHAARDLNGIFEAEDQ